MENVILSDKQIQICWEIAESQLGFRNTTWEKSNDTKQIDMVHGIVVAKAQARHLFEYLKEPCPHGVGDFHDKDEPVTMCMRLACSDCMAEIEKEIEGCPKL